MIAAGFDGWDCGFARCIALLDQRSGLRTADRRSATKTQIRTRNINPPRYYCCWL